MTWRVALAVAGVLVALTGIAAMVLAYTDSTRDVVTQVVNEQQVCSGVGSSMSCKYLIYTTGGTFEDVDSLLTGKFNSSDVYGELEIGHTYRLRVRGWRVPFFSQYPNILGIERSW